MTTKTWADLSSAQRHVLEKLEQNAAAGPKLKTLFGVTNDLTRELRSLGLTDKSGNLLTAAAKTLLDSRPGSRAEG